jgi:secondary thiamine-phosphate synthase enzyme
LFSMPTNATGAVVIRTHRHREVVDITETISRAVKSAGVAEGAVHVSLLHTTAALTTADLDPGTDLDLLDAFDAMVPKLRYRHPHDPSHVGDHILSALIGTHLALPVRGGQLVLGEWQRAVLVEFSGPRERRIVATVTAGAAVRGVLS